MKNFLHVGVQRGGNVVDDRYVPEKGEVSVGSSAKNTFALIGSNLPKEHVLFSFLKKHPFLHVTDGMNGEIALDGKAKESLGRLQARGQRSATGWSLKLPPAARGWLSVGDATFFFNITPKPPPPPKTELPASARTGILAGLERTFTTALIVVGLVEGGFGVMIKLRPDVALDQPTQEDLDRFAEIIMPEKPKEEPKKDDDDDAKKKAEEEAKKKAEEDAKKKKDDEDAKKKKDDDPEAAAKAEADRKAKLKAEVSKKGVLAVLGTTGGSGALANVFAASSGFGDDIGKALAGAGGVKIANGDDAGARRGTTGGGAVGIGDLGGAAGSGGAGVGLGEKKRVAAPQIAFDADDVDVDSASVDKDSLTKYIKLRIRSVQQCYEKELKLNPTLKGKIVMRFVVTTQGRVGDVSVDQNSMGNDNVAACIAHLIKTWSFPMKPEDDTPVSFPFIFSPGQ